MTPLPPRLLLLIENPAWGGILALALTDYASERVADPAAARASFRHHSFDLAILDLSPGRRLEELEMIREWRAAGAAFPIVVLSDLPRPGLAAEALAAGADDFLRKPFHHAELLGRLQRLRRNPQGFAGPRQAAGVLLGNAAFCFGGAEVTPDLTVGFPDGSRERIRPKQFGILRVFAQRAGGLVLKDELVREVWGSRHASGHSVNEYLSLLRCLFLQHGIDLNRWVASEPKAGWRIHPDAARSAVAEVA